MPEATALDRDHYAMPGDVQLHEHAYVTRVYYPRIGEGETLDVVMKPEFWSQCAKACRVGDVMELIADDGSFEWRGRITAKGPGKLWFRELMLWKQSTKKGEVDPLEFPGFQIKYSDPHNRYVIYRADGGQLQGGFQDKAAAGEYLRRYLAGEAREAA